MCDYPLESVGTTLLDTTEDGERRRVYMRERAGGIEVGELSYGPLTQAIFDAEERHHCVHLPCEERAVVEKVLETMGEGLCLVDLMDELDARDVPYGYLNSIAGQCVSYRPARKSIG